MYSKIRNQFYNRRDISSLFKSAEVILNESFVNSEDTKSESVDSFHSLLVTQLLKIKYL